MTLIVVRDLTKEYDGRKLRALDRVSLDVASGEWLALMGPSGSGKTTLLNLIAGLDTPTSGTVVVDGAPVHALDEAERARFRRDTVGVVFQHFHLIPYLTAVENVMLAQYFHSLADEAEAADALVRVGLGDRLHHRPPELSGGEQQRVAIARALINQPKLVVADEPTGNLDADNEAVVLETFQKLHAQGHTILLVTHDPRVGALADRRISLDHGRIMSAGLEMDFDNARWKRGERQS
ncbi:MAG: ABC transporter ATP-binding protein [Candidatus Rokubacteria bacterium]|nr:ABC transporter ATP-binding protein [Candidatus Rokubacteria bacterium]